uniref:protein-serine/threonine phosphatase n=1 Tax=Scleropages formosus TaxID=113540 RepID=A0A8C9STS1_SCLFO
TNIITALRVLPLVLFSLIFFFFPSISESFLTVKGAAVFLPRGNGSSPSSVPRITQRWNKHAGDLQQHLQTMFMLLRPEDTIRLAVRLESVHPQCTRYMVVVSTNGRQDTEESVVLGMDFSSSNGSCSVGLVLPLWSDTLIHLDGDGGFSVSTVNRVHVFKPVSVQAMWSALQSLHKACEVARCHNYYPGSLFLTWVSYYQSRVTSDQACINEWNAMRDVQSHRSDSPVLFTDVPTERERTERLIKMRLREIMMQKDLENVTSKEIRNELEMQMVCNLREFKEFIDNEMIVILGQMDSPTEIFDHVYLGSEWNASNLEELQTSGVRYILNVTREIDNFFPGLFEYHNIRVYDEEATNLLEYWNDTYKFISKAKKAGAKCLVHCKMGVSRSASTVIAYAMKEYGWDLERAFDHVKERRAVTKPNPSFMRQLEEYQGILLASKQRHNKLWRSHSDSDLSERHEPLCKTPHTLGRSDPHNNNSNPPSLQQFLGMAVLQALAVDKEEGLLDARGNESPRVTASSQPYQANGVSVRHIVTELESISQAVPFLCHTSLMCSQQEVAREEELSMEEPETRDGFVSNPLPSPSTQSLSMPPTDWPSGSVRRVTKQLEQRLRQELDSSLPSTSCQQFPPTSSRGHPNCGEGLVTVQQEEEQQRGGDDHKAEEEHGDDGRAFSGERVGLPVQSLIHAPNTNSPEPDPLPSVVNLQGVTELETDTEQVLDCKGGAELLGKRAHSSQDLEKIQETLRELQAFLSEAGGHERETEGLAGERVCPQSSEEVVSSKATLQRNVSELDARIRQAGLTPPSLMKRSASLAKLDRLELSTSDLSNWDFSPPPTPNPEQPPLASASQPHPIQDDATKKQRVLPSQPPSLSVESCTLEDCSKSVGSHLGDPEPKADSSLVRSAFSSDLPCRDGGGAQDAQVATLPVSLATRQQQGKIHYLRRLRKPGEKRRTAAFLYNTM